MTFNGCIIQQIPFPNFIVIAAFKIVIARPNFSFAWQKR